MGLYLKDQEQRSELQSRVANELQERLKQQQLDSGETDPAFTEGSHHTRPAGMILIILGAIAFIIVILVALRLGGIL